MLSFRAAAILIIGVTVVMSGVVQLFLPPLLQQFRVGFLLAKALAVGVWLFFAWKADQDKLHDRWDKEDAGTLWDGDFSQVDTNLSLYHFEAIRYHFDVDDNIRVVKRRHWFYLSWAVFFLILTAICIVGSLVLLVVHPEYNHVFHNIGARKIKPTRVKFSDWWIPFIPASFFLFEGLSRWQHWKWQEIRAITDTDLYIISQKPTYMPWQKAGLTVIEMGNLTAAEASANRGLQSLIGFGTVVIRRKFGDEMDRPEEIDLDYMPDYQGFYRELREARRPYEYRARQAALQPTTALPAIEPDGQSTESLSVAQLEEGGPEE